MGEFDFIARHFRPLAGAGAMELRNDGAVMDLPAGEELVLSSDTMVEGLHFLPDDPAKTIAQKLLRCNLSDLAAMGSRPRGYMLNISVPPHRHYDEAWFTDFAKGLAEDQKTFEFHLLGGDTTGSPSPLVLGVTILGSVRKGEALRRDRSQPGDGVWVTGSLGRATLGLQARLGALEDEDGSLTQAYRVPTPRIGLSLYGIVSAAMDISDGLIQDCGHIAEESGVSITLYEERLPLTPAVQKHLAQHKERILLGGDDYELLVTCPAAKEAALQAQCAAQSVPITRIGEVRKGAGVTMLDEEGKPLRFSRSGWQHF
ncbi:thiamine-phosphate kinase [Bombella sp. ESL0385]|uniref:thiamine-phosphate kinase n=1 Tax=Bombella sp. ESL0385 TaxID=2676446 RepID=UPI0012D8708D|nr:thiamine-phosphate kinase [Bombella sp. ESL0385]MUG90206.1 thiamine-phosphate kinase [Bombella sp. ESL0385]